MDTDIPTLRIRALNDAVRRQAATHRDTIITPGIAELPLPDQVAILDRVCRFDAFTHANDPHGEHDFGSFAYRGRTVFWKIDCYDLLLAYGSDDPSDPCRTRRALTIMLAGEY